MATKKNTSFLNKVYDRYLDLDWSLGKADLNPVREVNYKDIFAFDSDVLALRNKLLEDLKKTKVALQKEGLIPLDLNPLEDPEVDFNFSSSENLPKTNSSLKEEQLKQRLGSIGDSIFNSGAPDLLALVPPDPLIEEIDMLISQVGVFVVGKDFSGRSQQSLHKIKTILPGIMPLGPLCSVDSLAIGKPDLSSDNDNQENSGVGGEDGSNKASGSDFGNLEEQQDNADSLDALDAQAEALLEQLRVQAEGDNSSLEECALNTLGILKVIAIIAMIFTVYRIIVGYVLGILVPVMEIISLAGGLWVNPAGFAEISAKLSQTALALLTKMLCKLLKMLLDILNTDCLVSNALSTMDQILDSMSMADLMIADSKEAFSLTSDVVKAVKKMVKQVQSQIDDIKKNMSEEGKKKYLEDFKKSWKETYLKNMKSELLDDGYEILGTLKEGISPELEVLTKAAEQINNLNNSITSLFHKEDSEWSKGVTTAMASFSDILDF